MFGFGILSGLIVLPLIGAAFILVLRGEDEATLNNARYAALITTIVTFLLACYAWTHFDPAAPGFQFVEQRGWFGQGLVYKLGVDGMSFPFIVLTAFLMPFCILCSWRSIDFKLKDYFVAFLVLETLMIGVFSSLDLVLFYLFFEGGLIPMFLIIGIWGHGRKVYAAFKFFLYTLTGSLLMLLAIMAMYGYAGTTDITVLLKTHFPASMQFWLFLAFFASFAVKMPMWPVHTWLPDAHVEAPTAGSVILAGILLKMGGYGFLRFSLPMFPDASHYFAPLVFTLSVIAIIYTSLVALVQEDMKKLIAYSSVAHMGFVTMGLFAFTEQGIQGAIFQMVSHGIVSGALFLCVGVVYDRMHTREIAAYGGLVARMPRYATAFLILTMANVGLPGTSGFVGEFLTMLGTFQVNSWVALFSCTGVILSAAYALYLYRRVVFGVMTKDNLKSILDLNPRELGMLATLVVLTIFYGFHPSPILDASGPSVAAMVKTHEADLAASRSRIAASLLPRRGEGRHARSRRYRSMTPYSPMSLNIAHSLPELILAVGALFLLLFGAIRGKESDGPVTEIAVGLLGLAIVVLLLDSKTHAVIYDGMFVDDAFGRFMKVLTLLGSLVTLLMGQRFLAREKIDKFEYPILVVLSTLGALILISATGLITLYLGLELMSLALYVLAAFHRDNRRASEAGLKYFVLGALSSGMLLYGASLLYGFAGTVEFSGIAVAIGGKAQIGVVFGLVFLMAGLAFKMSVAPFHMWTPDVYQGAPTPVTAFFATAPKLAAVAITTRVIITAFPGITVQWQQLVVAISILSMALGSFAAIGQTDIKRLMAYSAIGNMGFALVGLAAGTPEGVQGVVIYMAIYLVMTLGTFAAILSMKIQGRQLTNVADLMGLSKTHPGMAFFLAMMMFSLAGIPPLAGFFAKFYVFNAAIHANLFGLAVVGVLLSVVAAFYYLRIVKFMYFDEASVPFDRQSPMLQGVLAIAGVLVLAFWLYPPPFIGAATAAAKSLF